MKTHDTTSDHDYRSRAAANNPQRDTGSEKADLVAPGPAAQRKHTDMIETSPYMVSQRKRLSGLSGRALQKQGAPEEEELLQGKPAAQMQPEDEEELLQGKITDPFQSPEEEELRQAKSAVQRQPEEEEELQGKFAAQRQALEEEEPLQGKFSAQRQTRENRTGMPDDIKAHMESSLDADFSDVRVHPNSDKATEVGALAYTQGADMHFAPGQFKPESSAGQQLLGHELTHVVQQSQGRVEPTGEVAGLPVNDSPDLENEADRMAQKV